MAAKRTQIKQRAIAEDPPDESSWQRTSFWVLVFAEARKEDRWFRVDRFYTATTAAQIASDIRSAAHRPLDKLRVRGILPGETWTARWGTDDKCPPGHFAIWIRLTRSDA